MSERKARINITLSQEIKDRLEAAAKRRWQSSSQVAEMLISQWLAVEADLPQPGLSREQLKSMN